MKARTSMQLTQGLRRSSHLFGSRNATVFGERRTSWCLLEDRVARLAYGLRSLGALAGDRIGILALNSDRYIVAYYAIIWAGCVVVPFNTRWASAEIGQALEDSAPRIMMLDANFKIYGAEFAARGIEILDMDAVGDGSLNQLIATSPPLPDEAGNGYDLAMIFYTGGTTGGSKGVMLSHANLVLNSLALQNVTPYDEDTIFLHVAPMFHVADASCLFGMTLIGATQVVLPTFDAQATINAIEQHQVTATLLVPTMIGLVCEAAHNRPANLSSLRRLNYGASPISETVLKQAMAVLPQAEFYQLYGQTELSPVATVLDHRDHVSGYLRSAGRPIPQVDVRIVDQEFREVPRGVVGEIVARGPCVMLGYWQKPALTAEAIIDGWLRTGDAGHIDENGYLFLVDRIKDMIVSGGENIYSGEVENALMQHPDVLQCAVIGIPDHHWGEAVHAILYLRDGSTTEPIDFVAHCKPLIANYKLPKTFDLRKTSLPLSGAGKILKAELRKPFWNNIARNIS